MGFSAISNANGWEITIVGMGTVFFALFLLFLILSNLHKVIVVWENKNNFLSRLFKKTEPFPGYKLIKNEPYIILQQAHHAYLLYKLLNHEFYLTDLYDLAKKRGVEISDKCIKILLDKKIIIPLGRQKYMWNE